MDVVTPCSAVTMFPLLYQKVLLFLVSYTAMGIGMTLSFYACLL